METIATRYAAQGPEARPTAPTRLPAMAKCARIPLTPAMPDRPTWAEAKRQVTALIGARRKRLRDRALADLALLNRIITGALVRAGLHGRGRGLLALLLSGLTTLR